jgi:hypothetical protein
MCIICSNKYSLPYLEGFEVKAVRRGCGEENQSEKKKHWWGQVKLLPSRFYMLVNHKLYNRQAIASGLNAAWIKAQKSRKKGTMVQGMDDDMALSTRPDFPPSPKLDRKAVHAQLATAKAGGTQSTQKNLVRSFTVDGSHFALNLTTVACCM